jgi:hypothetical protein
VLHIRYYFSILIAVGLGLLLLIKIKENDLIAYQQAENCKDPNFCKVVIEAEIVDAYAKYGLFIPQSSSGRRSGGTIYPRYFVTISFSGITQNIEVFSLLKIGKSEIEIWKNKPTYIYSYGSEKTIYHPETALLRAKDNLQFFIFASITLTILGWILFFYLERG